MKSGTQQIFGIKELYKPKGEEPDVDIVAVHGLTGDALKTWTSEKGKKKCWLNHDDLLPRYMKRARVLVWGYNANIISHKGRTTSSNRILHHAQTLVQDLWADRNLEDATDRPIIFLCHSLGGIVVKRALAHAASRDAPKVEHLNSIYTCTFGILFFGTPHHGESKAHLLGALTKMASLTMPSRILQFESSLVNALEEESETLQNITDQFVPLMSKCHIHFFWEQEKTDLYYTKDFIVQQSSAAPNLYGIAGSGIASDHQGMCRFEDPTEQGFRTVISILKDWQRKAPHVIHNRTIRSEQVLSEDRKHAALELLRGCQPLSDISRTAEMNVRLSQLKIEELQRNETLVPEVFTNGAGEYLLKSDKLQD